MITKAIPTQLHPIQQKTLNSLFTKEETKITSILKDILNWKLKTIHRAKDRERCNIHAI